MLSTHTPAEDALLPHLGALHRWCLRRCGDPHLADDVAQETLLAALRQLDRLRDPACLRSWLFKIAACRLADAARSRPEELPLTMEPPAPPQEAEEPDPKQIRRVRRALKRLPLFLRKPMRLHYLKGRPLRDVARTLDTTVNGVKARLYRARRLLRERGLR